MAALCFLGVERDNREVEEVGDSCTKPLTVACNGCRKGVQIVQNLYRATWITRLKCMWCFGKTCEKVWWKGCSLITGKGKEFSVLDNFSCLRDRVISFFV